MKLNVDFVVLISADAEWRVINSLFLHEPTFESPYGNWFSHRYFECDDLEKPVVFFHGGWGKVAASGSTQYIISRWQPALIVNLGTCGGFAGRVEKGEIILADKTVIYDIYELMGDPDEHIEHYSTCINNDWLPEPYPIQVKRSILLSADRDLLCEEINTLKAKYDAVAGDWESGPIAWIAAKNQTPCLILRGVTDLVSVERGEAYDGNINKFFRNTEIIMRCLVESLPGWLSGFVEYKRNQSLKK